MVSWTHKNYTIHKATPPCVQMSSCAIKWHRTTHGAKSIEVKFHGTKRKERKENEVVERKLKKITVSQWQKSVSTDLGITTAKMATFDVN